jgi:hypothetical protein
MRALPSWWRSTAAPAARPPKEPAEVTDAEYRDSRLCPLHQQSSGSGENRRTASSILLAGMPGF